MSADIYVLPGPHAVDTICALHDRGRECWAEPAQLHLSDARIQVEPVDEPPPAA